MVMAIFDRLGNAWQLFKLSLDFVRRDKSLLAVPILLPIVNLILFATFAVVIVLGLLAGVVTSERYLVLAIIGVVYLFISLFINTFLGAAHSWMVFEVAKGKDATLGSGMRRAGHEWFDIAKFAAVMTLIKIIASLIRGQRKQGFDIGYQARNAAASALEGITGIIGKLVLPAMIITDKTFGESVKELRQSLKTWPEILAFELGIGPIVGIVFLLALVAILVVSFALSGISFLGAIIFGVLAFVLLIIALNVLSTLVNMTYYTLLYLALVEKKRIKDAKDVFYTKF